MPDEFWINAQLEVIVTCPEGSQRIVLNQPYALVGSAPCCDVVLPDPRLPARCFAALMTATGLVGVSLARQSMARFRLLNGDRGIRAGRFRVRFQPSNLVPDGADLDELPATPGNGDLAAHIYWSTADRKRYVQLQDEQPLLFGRRPPSRVCIDDRAVSSIHGIVYRHATRLWLIDLGSTNGTFVGRRRARCTPLAAGESFEVGSTLIQYKQAKRLSDGENRPGKNVVAADWVRITAPTDPPSIRLADIDRLQQDVNDLRQQLTDLRSQVEHWGEQATEWALSEQRRQEQYGEWVRVQQDKQRELEGHRQQLTNAQRDHMDRVARWEQERDAELRRIGEERCMFQDRLRHEWESFERARFELRQRQAEWANRLAHLTHDCELYDQQHTTQQIELQREAERLLVRRIRLQRELQRRDAELTQRELQLEARERVLDDREAAQPLAPATNGHARKAPGPPAALPPAMTQLQVATTAPACIDPDDQFELANPLLESADFTQLLSRFIVEQESDGDS